MRTRDVSISLVLVILAVVVQTAVFGDGRINPWGASPTAALVVVLACARYLDPEPALLLGFTAGMLLDLLGGAPLGLWAMAYTVSVYIALRYRSRADDGPVIVGLGVFLITLIAHSLFVIIGTLFGERFFTSAAVIKDTVLPAAYNVALAAVVFPVVSRLIGRRQRLGWTT